MKQTIQKFRDNEQKIMADKEKIGAVFGQTEGLFGPELDLRELQKTGRIGRIEIDLHSKKRPNYRFNNNSNQLRPCFYSPNRRKRRKYKSRRTMLSQSNLGKNRGHTRSTKKNNHRPSQRKSKKSRLPRWWMPISIWSA
jgi:hypothetical protein